ncbi:hypothetical protein VCHENC02_2077A, partial [Vibrio harveyi]
MSALAFCGRTLDVILVKEAYIA